jgi:hypothetical protein
MDESARCSYTVEFYISTILVFIFRLLGKPQYWYWIEYFEFRLPTPMIFLLLNAPQLERPAVYKL